MTCLVFSEVAIAVTAGCVFGAWAQQQVDNTVTQRARIAETSDEDPRTDSEED